MKPMQLSEIIQRNLKTLISPETREVALGESIGGNAGMASYALNMEISPEGEILYVGNEPSRTNATVRIFIPAFATRKTQLHEMGVEIWGDSKREEKSPLSKSIWIWNLYREKTEHELLDLFMTGDLSWEALLEFLRTKYPRLVRELE